MMALADLAETHVGWALNAGAIRLRADKIASSTKRLGLQAEVEVFQGPWLPKIGDVVAIRTLTDSATYNHLELVGGRVARINVGDVILGVLGRRQALKGFVGELPGLLRSGDRLHLLNQGGVIGLCTGFFHEMGRPIEAELVGRVIQGGQGLDLQDTALPAVDRLQDCAPLIVVAGTCMQAGKTRAAAEIIKRFSREGWKVSAAKLSGVACLRDTLHMEDHGATETLSFLDCGYPSTVGVDDLAGVARSILAALMEKEPEIIVLELGDGLLGGYKVGRIFEAPDIVERCAAVVFCANDFVGAWGGIQILEKKGIGIDVIAGPTTDSLMGMEYIEAELGVPAANAVTHGDKLFSLLEAKIQTKPRRPSLAVCEG